MRKTIFVLLSCLVVAWGSPAFAADSDKKEMTPALRELLSKAGAAQLSEVKVQTPVAQPVSKKNGGQKIYYQCVGDPSGLGFSLDFDIAKWQACLQCKGMNHDKVCRYSCSMQSGGNSYPYFSGACD